MERYNKAWIALVIAILGVLENVFGLSWIGISEEWVNTLFFVLTPILVYLVPNRG